MHRGAIAAVVRRLAAEPRQRPAGAKPPPAAPRSSRSSSAMAVGSHGARPKTLPKPPWDGDGPRAAGDGDGPGAAGDGEGPRAAGDGEEPQGWGRGRWRR